MDPTLLVGESATGSEDMAVVGERVGDKRKREQMALSPPASTAGDITGDEAPVAQPAVAVAAVAVDQSLSEQPGGENRGLSTHDSLRKQLMAHNELQAKSRKAKAQAAERAGPY